MHELQQPSAPEPDLPPDRIVSLLRPYLSDERAARIEAVLAGRTRQVVPVLEGLYDAGNLSAVLRSADAFGFQDVHLIRNGETLRTSTRPSRGAERWVDLRVWERTADALAGLRAARYRILALHPAPDALPLTDVDFTRRTALVLGNEREGLTPALLAAADARVAIPMAGMVQSLNVSVAAAVALFQARTDRLARQGTHGDLRAEECADLRARAYLLSVRNAAAILHRAARTP